jgi:hypothetical protein
VARAAKWRGTDGVANYGTTPSGISGIEGGYHRRGGAFIFSRLDGGRRP